MDEATWTPDQLWKRALKHSKQVEIDAPEEIEVKDDTDTIAEREFIKRAAGDVKDWVRGEYGVYEKMKAQAEQFVGKTITHMEELASRNYDVDRLVRIMTAVKKRVDKIQRSLGDVLSKGMFHSKGKPFNQVDRLHTSFKWMANDVARVVQGIKHWEKQGKPKLKMAGGGEDAVSLNTGSSYHPHFLLKEYAQRIREHFTVGAVGGDVGLDLSPKEGPKVAEHISFSEGVRSYLKDFPRSQRV